MTSHRSRAIFASITSLALLWAGAVQAQAPPPEDEQAALIHQLKTISIAEVPPSEPLARTAYEMRRYVNGRSSETELLWAIKRAYPDLQLRDALNLTKTRIIQLLGADDAEHVLGEIYLKDVETQAGAPRGSQLEDRLLEWRGRLPEEIESGLAAEFKGRNVVNGERHSVFFADVGGQPGGAPGERIMPGDHDVNVISSSRELASEIAARGDAMVLERTAGLLAVEIDVVFTAMGRSGPEVYAGEAGRAVALRLIAEGRCGNVRRVDLDAGVLGEATTGPEALKEVGVEAGLRAAAVQPIEGIRLPEAGPAAVFELARHLDRDVLRHMQFEDMDSLFKIAKFVERADLVAGELGYPLDSKLVEFSKNLLEVKSSRDWPRATALVREHFGDLPVEVRLDRSPDPMSPATISANRQLVEGFGNRCLGDLLDLGKAYLKDEIGDLRGRVRLAQDGFEDARALADDMARLMYDMEVENLILKDPVEGLRTVDPELVRLTDDLHKVNRQLLGSRWEDILTDDLKQQREFIRRNLEQGGETNRDLAAAALFTEPEDAVTRALEAVNGLNAVLDSLDDTLLGPLRGDSDWRDGLLAARAAAISEHSAQLHARRLLPESARGYYDSAQGQVVRIENRLNRAFYDNFLAKRIQRTNEIFRESVQASSAGTAAMTGLQMIRLQGEMGEYWAALDEGDWEGLAVRFFRNRVPAGGAVENLVMGNYGLATFDLFATVVPPASLAKMALDVGMEAGTDAWDFYWTSMLKEFTKELYDGATWRVRRTDLLGSDIEVGSWELVAVTYRDREVRIRDYVEEKRRQLAEMQDAARLRPAGEQIPFPYEYASQDPLTGWLAGDDILRENLAHQDNILLILDEARHHPAAGWRQQDHIHKVWTTRWEQVKLAWMLQTIDELERLKRAAEFGPERFTEAVRQLHEITDELRITEQVDSSLADEGVPPTIMSFLRWLTDATPDAVVEFYEMPSADDAWVEATRIVLDALEVYDTVLAARRDAEAEFVAPGRSEEDSGLRMLTTPFLLTGRPSTDQRGYERWRGLPMAVATSVHDELDAIKNELGPGGGLDLADGSFDAMTLSGIVYHDTFKEMWKHVQVTTAEVRGSTSNLDFEVWWELWKQSKVGDSEAAHAFLDGARDRITGADTLEGLGSRDLPLERFRAHDAARDDLVFAFIEHYLLGNDRLTELEERAAALAAEIAAACDDAHFEAEAVRVAAESMSAHAEDIDTTLATIGPALDETPIQLAEVADRHLAAETAATECGDAAVTAEGLSLELCELLPQLRSATTTTAQRPLLDRMEGLAQSLEREVERGESSNGDVGRAADAAAAALERAASTLDAVDNATEAATDIGDGADERARLDAARSRLDEARTALGELEGVKAEALDLLDRVTRAVDGLPEDQRLVALLQTVEARIDRIVAAPDTVAGCPNEAGAVLDAVAARLDEGARALAAARSRLEAFESRVEGLRTELAAADRTVDAAEELASVSGAYVERLHAAAEGARLCLDVARDLAAAADRPMVPDVVGMNAADAVAVLGQAGFATTLVSGEAAPEPRFAHTVRSQVPAGGEPAADGAAVSLRLWGESAMVAVPVVVGLSAAEAKAAVEGAGLRAGMVAGDPAMTPDLAFVVESQSPGGGSQVDRGSTVTLHILGAFDATAAVRNVDCSAWPGTEAVWDDQIGAPECRCPAATHWDGFSQRCVAAAPDVQAAAAPPVDSRCNQLGEAFWSLMLAQRVDEARGVLAQAADCDFSQRGLAALQEQRDLDCLRLNNQILAACLQRDLAQSQSLMQVAYAQGCAVAPEAYSCVQDAQRGEQIQRNQQAWGQVFATMNDLIRMQQDVNNQRTNAATQNLGGLTVNPVNVDPNAFLSSHGAAPPGSLTPTGPTTGGGTTAGGSGGRSADDCLRQYCPMCFNDVDLLGASVDPQCNSCRSLNAANIRACQEGGQAGTAVQTTATYRVVCAMSEPDANGHRWYTWCSCANPNDVIGANSRVIASSRSWDECKATADRMNAQR
jgi:hypothetical protein